MQYFIELRNVDIKQWPIALVCGCHHPLTDLVHVVKVLLYGALHRTLRVARTHRVEGQAQGAGRFIWNTEATSPSEVIFPACVAHTRRLSRRVLHPRVALGSILTS